MQTTAKIVTVSIIFMPHNIVRMIEQIHQITQENIACSKTNVQEYFAGITDGTT